MEHLRYVARSRVGPQRVASEAAWALADLVYWVEPQGLLPACRRLVEWHPAAGPLWNLAVRVLAAADPAEEARLFSRELAGDTTAFELAQLIPQDARVVALGGDMWRETRRLRPDLREVPAGRAADRADVALIEAAALGPDGFVAVRGASDLCRRRVPVWVVASTGVVVGRPVWDRVLARLASAPSYEVVDRTAVSRVVGPAGEETWGVALSRAVPEAPPPTLR